MSDPSKQLLPKEASRSKKVHTKPTEFDVANAHHLEYVVFEVTPTSFSLTREFFGPTPEKEEQDRSGLRKVGSNKVEKDFGSVAEAQTYACEEATRALRKLEWLPTQ